MRNQARNATLEAQIKRPRRCWKHRTPRPDHCKGVAVIQHTQEPCPVTDPGRIWSDATLSIDNIYEGPLPDIGRPLPRRDKEGVLSWR